MKHLWKTFNVINVPWKKVILTLNYKKQISSIVTTWILRTEAVTRIPEAVAHRCSVKKVFCLRPATLLRKTLTQVFSCEFCEISTNTFSYRNVLLKIHRKTPASESLFWCFKLVPIKHLWWLSMEVFDRTAVHSWKFIGKHKRVSFSASWTSSLLTSSVT